MNIIRRLRLDLAAVQRFDLCDDRLALLHRIRKPHEVHFAFIDRQTRPVRFIECLLGGRDGALNVVRLHIGDGGQFLPGPGIVGVESVPV